MTRQLVTAASGELITLAEARAYRQIGDSTDFDDVLTKLIAAAVRHTEKTLSRALLAQQWDVFLPCFPHCDRTIALPLGRLLSVDEFEVTLATGDVLTWSVEEGGANLLDDAGVVAHVDTTDDQGGRITLAHNRTWPVGCLKASNPIRIRVTVGYGEVSDVPEDILLYMQLWLGDAFEHRETLQAGLGLTLLELPTARALLEDYRVR